MKTKISKETLNKLLKKSVGAIYKVAYKEAYDELYSDFQNDLANVRNDYENEIRDLKKLLRNDERAFKHPVVEKLLKDVHELTVENHTLKSSVDREVSDNAKLREFINAKHTVAEIMNYKLKK